MLTNGYSVNRSEIYGMLTVIIVSWNTEGLLKLCLEAVQIAAKCKYLCDVVVVDNASTDNSVGMVRKFFPEVHLLVNNENVGFSRANNLALEYCSCKGLLHKYLLFLNSDVIVSNRLFDNVLSEFEANTHIGVASPALLLPDGTFQVGAAGYRLSPLSTFIYFSLLFKILPLPLARGMYIDQSRYVGLMCPVALDWVSGACLFARAEVVSTTGGWDESSFMYAEDIDLCERIRDSNYSVIYYPMYSVIHYHGSSSKNTAVVNTKWLPALFFYVKRTRGKFEYVIFRILTFWGTAVRFACYGALSLIQSKRYMQKAREMYAYLMVSLRGR